MFNLTLLNVNDFSVMKHVMDEKTKKTKKYVEVNVNCTFLKPASMLTLRLKASSRNLTLDCYFRCKRSCSLFAQYPSTL